VASSVAVFSLDFLDLLPKLMESLGLETPGFDKLGFDNPLVRPFVIVGLAALLGMAGTDRFGLEIDDFLKDFNPNFFFVLISLSLDAVSTSATASGLGSSSVFSAFSDPASSSSFSTCDSSMLIAALTSLSAAAISSTGLVSCSTGLATSSASGLASSSTGLASSST